MLPESQAAIDRFADALWIEDGLAPLTLAAYRRDLSLYAAWLADEAGRAIDESRESELLGYISARHAEMERIVTQALPGAPRVLEPALQLEAAWQRARNASGGSGAGLLLSLFAQSGSAPALTALDVSERALRATFADSAALQRHAAACDSAALRSALQRAGVRCTREGERLLLDFSSESATSGLKG